MLQFLSETSTNLQESPRISTTAWISTIHRRNDSIVHRLWSHLLTLYDIIFRKYQSPSTNRVFEYNYPINLVTHLSLSLSLSPFISIYFLSLSDRYLQIVSRNKINRQFFYRLSHPRTPEQIKYFYRFIIIQPEPGRISSPLKGRIMVSEKP